jgi:hypothetical protein
MPHHTHTHHHHHSIPPAAPPPPPTSINHPTFRMLRSGVTAHMGSRPRKFMAVTAVWSASTMWPPPPRATPTAESRPWALCSPTPRFSTKAAMSATGGGRSGAQEQHTRAARAALGRERRMCTVLQLPDATPYHPTPPHTTPQHCSPSHTRKHTLGATLHTRQSPWAMCWALHNRTCVIEPSNVLANQGRPPSEGVSLGCRLRAQAKEHHTSTHVNTSREWASN